MLKLLKYEFYKRSRYLLIGLLIMVLLEAGVLFGFFKGDGWIALSVFLMLLLFYGALIFALVDTIRSFSAELNQKSGYSLFLTPTSGYKIIASKAIFSFIELIFATALLFGVMFINYKVLNYLYWEDMNVIVKDILTALKDTGFIPRVIDIVVMVLVMIFEWFNMIMVAILAMTLRKTIFSNTKFGWLISFLFFMFIYGILSTITMVVLVPFGYFHDLTNFIRLSAAEQPINEYTFDIFKYILISLCLYPIYVGTTFFFSGKLLNKRVDL